MDPSDTAPSWVTPPDAGQTRPSEDQRTVYRADAQEGVVGTRRPGFDLPATLGGALAALGTFVLLSAIVGAAVGSIGYQADVEGRDLGIGALVAGLVVLFLSCLLGGWVAGRITGWITWRRGGLHGLVATLWLVVLAAALAALAAVAAVVTGLVALALVLGGGWLGGHLAARHAHHERVELVAHRSAVRRHDGGIVAQDRR